MGKFLHLAGCIIVSLNAVGRYIEVERDCRQGAFIQITQMSLERSLYFTHYQQEIPTVATLHAGPFPNPPVGVEIGLCVLRWKSPSVMFQPVTLLL